MNESSMLLRRCLSEWLVLVFVLVELGTMGLRGERTKQDCRAVFQAADSVVLVRVVELREQLNKEVVSNFVKLEVVKAAGLVGAGMVIEKEFGLRAPVGKTSARTDDDDPFYAIGAYYIMFIKSIDGGFKVLRVMYVSHEGEVEDDEMFANTGVKGEVEMNRGFEVLSNAFSSQRLHPDQVHRKKTP